MKILDATYVPVCASLFPWANFMPSKSAVKLHFLLDCGRGTPQDLQVTAGQVHELEVARTPQTSPPATCCCWTGAMWTLPGSTPCTNRAWALSPGCRATSAIRWCRRTPCLPDARGVGRSDRPAHHCSQPRSLSRDPAPGALPGPGNRQRHMCF